MKYVLIALLLFTNPRLYAQSYTVIHSIGKIYDKSSGSYLKKGSRISEAAELTFESPDARAAVLSSSRGRFIIQQTSKSGSQSDLAYTLTSVLSPVRGRLSTRAGGINNKLDFEKHFGEGPIALIGQGYQVSVSSAAYPMDDSRFFYVQYTHVGERINKKLNSVNDSLYFETSSLYSVDGMPINASETSETRLFYFDSEKQESTLITVLDFSVVTKYAIQSLDSSLEELPEEERTSALVGLINDLYGKCRQSDVDRALGQ